MAKKRFNAEQIVTLLRQIEVAMGLRVNQPRWPVGKPGYRSRAITVGARNMAACRLSRPSG